MKHPKSFLIFLTFLLALTSLAFADSSPVSSSSEEEKSLPKTRRAVLIVLEGDVDQGMAHYVARAIQKALKEEKPDLILFEINTFGGLLESAFSISDMMLALKDVNTVALVDKKAISAGAIIALSAQKLYMRPSTTIGDCAPVTQGQEGPVMLGEKIQSPLRARFRTLAEKHGYPSLLSQAMVTAELEVLELSNDTESWFVLASEWEEMSEKERAHWKNKKTLVKSGELLTLTNQEAEKYGFSEGTVEGTEALMETLGVSSWKKVEITWAEKIARALGKIAPLLMLIGFGALYMEMQTPGFGIFGIIGITALLLVFGGQSIAGLADHAALALFILGAALVLLEAFVFPGTWISGIIGIGLLALAMMLSLGSVSPPPTSPTDEAPHFLDTARILSNLSTVIFSAVSALIFPLLLSKAIARWLPGKAGIALSTTLEDSFSPLHDNLPPIGAQGVTTTLLRPTGKVRIDEMIFEATAQTGFIEPGSIIEVKEILDGRLFVMPVEESE